MKKVGLKAIAGGLALMLAASLVVPATAKAADDVLLTAAAGKVLVITQDMVDAEGEFVLSGENFDKVVLPSDVKITNFYVDGCEIGEFTVEGGNNPNVQLWDAKIDNVVVSAAELIDVNDAIKEYLDMMKGKETTPEFDINGFLKDVQNANNRASALAPKISLMGADMASSNQEIGALTIAGNATVDFAEGKNPGAVNVAFASSQTKMDVTIENYKGDVNVDQTTAAGDTFGILNLKTKNSEIANVNVKAQGNANIALRTADAKVANVNYASTGDASAMITLASPVENVKVAGSSANATVKLLASATNVDVDGKGVTLNLGPAATIKTTNVAGSGNVVSGTGSVGECKIAEGASASVEIVGAAVEGDNSYQPIISAPAAPDRGEIEPEVPGIVLVPMQPENVTVDGNKAVIVGQYKTAIYKLPGNIDGSKVSSVKTVVSTDTQIFIKVAFTDGSVVETWCGAGTNQTKTIAVASGTVSQVEYMSLDDTTVTIEVSSVEFTLREDVEDEGGNTEGGSGEAVAIDFATKVVVSGNAPTASGDALAFAAGQNKCAFTLPTAVAAGEKVKFTVDMDFADVATNSTIRFYLIADNNDIAVSDQAYIKTPELDSASVQKTLTVTATGRATQLLFVTFAWDGSSQQDVTLNGITVQ